MVSRLPYTQPCEPAHPDLNLGLVECYLSTFLRGARLGFRVVHPKQIACELLRLLGADGDARPGQAEAQEHMYTYTFASKWMT
jgi:hypothetical protein